MKNSFSSKFAGTGLKAASQKKILTSAILLSLGGFAASTNAATPSLSNGALGLDIVGNLNPACLYGGTYPGCNYGAFDTADAGSFFNMDGDPAAAVDGDAILMLDGSPLAFNGTAIPPTYVGDGVHVTATWDFFSALGTNVHAGLPVLNGDTQIDMASWGVVWAEVPFINMGGDTANQPSDTGIAALTCPGGTCEVGESFTIDYAAHVPAGDPSMFGGVLYELHFQGTVVSLPNDPPTAISEPLLASTAPNGTIQIDLASNVKDDLGAGVDVTSFVIAPYTGARSPVPDITVDAAGLVTYKDNDGSATGAPDTFSYTVADGWDAISASFTVEVSVVTGNIPPVAQSFTVTANKEQAIIVDVVANVTDNDGTVDATTVQTQNVLGGAVDNIDANTGHVTFTPSVGVLGPGAASFDYKVKDNTGDFSNIATVTVNVNDPPVAGDDTVSVDRNSVVVVDVVALTTDPDGGTVNPASVVATQGTNGTTTVDLANGQVTYTPTFGSSFLGADQFTYTIDDDNGATSNSGTITVNIVNALPVAVNDITSIDITVNASVDIDVTSNDTDSDGTINNTTVVITTNPTDGNATVGGTGVITYTPNPGFVGGDTLQYTVQDDDSSVSNVATVFITVSDDADFCEKAPLAADSCFLQFNSGNIIPLQKPVLGDGSYFTMEVQVGVPLPTALVAQNSLQLNTVQLASTGPLVPNIDQAWLFFGNLGVSQTTSAPTVTSDDGAGNVTLDFSGWDVSWNFIPSINLGSGAHSGGVDGVATMTCYADDLVAQTPGDCSAGNVYVLDYYATVPPGDPSGFGGVKYSLHLEGTVAVSGVVFSPAVPPNTTDIQAIDGAGTTVTVQPGSVATAAGSTTGTNLTAADIGNNDPLLNPKDGVQCQGGCVDFVVTGFTGDYVDIIFRLNTPLLEGALYRKLINGIWSGLDTSGEDQLGSNAEVAGACTDDQFAPGLLPGNQCIFLRIYDGGPNDADGEKNGTIVDPSGALVAGSPNTPAGSTSGCSISPVPVSLRDRADWILVALFVGLLGAIKFRRKHIS